MGVITLANYTMTIREIVEMLNHLEHVEQYPQINDMINNAIPFIFDFSYPTISEDFKNMFEFRFIKHFYMREIGCETFPLFKIYLDNLLNEIMPYYNKLLKMDEQLDDIGIFKNIDFTRILNRNTDGTENAKTVFEKTGETNSTKNTENTGTIKDDGSTNKTGTVTDTKTGSETETGNDTTSNSGNRDESNKYSDTPQGGMAWADISGDVYLTNATVNTVETSDNSNTTKNNERDYNETNKRENALKDTNTNTRTLDTADNTTENSSSEENSTNNLDKTTGETVLEQETITGKNSGSDFIDVALKYREYAMNILRDILEDCEVLFMGVW